MSRRLDLATIRLQFQHKYLRLVPLGMSAVLSGCSLLPLQDRPAMDASSPEGSALMLRQADARGYAAGFEAGRRLQALRDRESAEAAAKSSATASSAVDASAAVSATALSNAATANASNTATPATVPPVTVASAPASAANAGSSLLVPSASAALASGQTAPGQTASKQPALGRTAQAATSPSRVTDPGPPATGNFVPRGVASPVDGSPDPF
jgi:hypothetical protein